LPFRSNQLQKEKEGKRGKTEWMMIIEKESLKI